MLTFCDRTYNNLAIGIRTRNVKMIEAAKQGLALYGSKPTDIGFTSATIEGHYNRVTDKLSKFSMLLDKVGFDLTKINRNSSRSVMQQRVTLSRTAIEITEDIRILSGIQEILAAELKRRGTIVEVMVEERHVATVPIAVW